MSLPLHLTFFSQHEHNFSRRSVRIGSLNSVNGWEPNSEWPVRAGKRAALTLQRLASAGLPSASMERLCWACGLMMESTSHHEVRWSAAERKYLKKPGSVLRRLSLKLTVFQARRNIINLIRKEVCRSWSWASLPLLISDTESKASLFFSLGGYGEDQEWRSAVLSESSV